MEQPDTQKRPESVAKRRDLLRGLLRGGSRRTPSGLLAKILLPYAAAIGVYEVWLGAKGTLDPYAISAFFLTAMLVIVFLTVGATPASSERGPTVPDYLAALTSLAAGIYLVVEIERIVSRVSLFDPLFPLDIFFGLALFLLTIEAARRTVGFGLVAVVVGFVLYIFAGHLLPGQFWHRPVSLYHFLDQIVFTTNGIFGLPVRVAATYAFLFVMFGTFLEKSGGGDFYFDLAAAISGRSAGGPAKVAVVSSGLYGMMSGSPTADVMTTGSITIPMMKRLGYSPVFAAAVETSASTGGSIMPPIMGSAAFLMAEFTGVSYATIALAALLPALLYYAAVYLQVHFRAVRRGMGALPAERIPKLHQVIARRGLFLVPLIVLTWFLAHGYTASYTAIMGVASVLVVAMLKKESRLGLRAIYDSLATTTMRMVPVTAACAAAGLVIGGITMTGLAGKFVRLVLLVSSGNLFLALLVTMVVVIILGMGMPTPSAYVLAAVLVAPTLLELGVAPISGHLFVVYFAVMSAITPPVAVAAYAAASLADDSPFRISLQAVRLSMVAFLVPFIFVYQPALLMQEGILAGIVAFVTALAGVLGLAAAGEGYLILPLGWLSRIALFAGGLVLMYPGLLSDLAGLSVMAVVAGPQILRKRRFGVLGGRQIPERS